MDDSGKRESEGEEEKAPKKKAEGNPWYLLATLYGVPEPEDHELQLKNRLAWNRYFAANLDEETRKDLIEERQLFEIELVPFSLEELQEIATAFAERCKVLAKELALPSSSADIDFSNLVFEQDAFFEGYSFSRFSCFRSAVFSGDTSFRGAAFSVLASFDGAAFFGPAIFDGVFFSARAVASFHGAAFSGGAAFGDATFSNDAIFDRAVFSLNAFFKGTAFFDQASFFGATFSGEADFDGAAFPAGANFNGTSFCDKASFFGATFSRTASFSRASLGEKIIFTRFGGTTSFVNAEMNAETSFQGAIFEKKPPWFFGAKLHQGTVWRDITWPPMPKDKDNAGEFIDAYACLTLEMDRLKKHDDELDFFALELQSRRVLLGPLRGLPIALYGLVSDYGRSYARPLYALFAVAALGMLVLLLFGALAPRQSLGLSIANTLNVFGFRKDFFEPG